MRLTLYSANFRSALVGVIAALQQLVEFIGARPHCIVTRCLNVCRVIRRGRVFTPTVPQRHYAVHNSERAGGVLGYVDGVDLD